MVAILPLLLLCVASAHGQKPAMILILFLVTIYNGIDGCTDFEDVWEKVGCNEDFVPDNCDFNEIPLLTVEDFDRCGPAMLNRTSRNYYLGASGRRITYNDNKKAYRRIRIVPRNMRDISKSSLDTETLGQKVSFPIGLSPMAYQKLANPLGEIATVRAISDMGTIMILSSYSSTTIEEVAENNAGGSSHLWLQTFIFANRSFTEHLVRRAEQAGFEAIVITVDYPIPAQLSCDARLVLNELVNLPGVNPTGLVDNSQTFKDLAWVRSITNLPIVAKGILSVSDAVRAVRAGVSAIIVSNHGGRQLDSAPPTIEVLPDIVDAVKRLRPRADVYVDGGIRNGWDIYKAIASGAKMAFIGRPVLWGLAKEGENGVRQIFNILRKEFQEAMLLSGSSKPSAISRDTLRPASSSCRFRKFIQSEDVWEKVGCNEVFVPENCNFSEIPLLTVEDYGRCGPAMLNQSSRNYFLGASGRRITYNENRRAYTRIRIVPNVLRDVFKSSLDTETLRQKVSFPIGLSPVAFQKFAHPLGEIATVRAISDMGTIMILSSFASTTIEEVANNAEGRTSHLWMQTNIFKNRTFIENLVRRAERAGFEAIVVSVDTSVAGELTCNGRGLGGEDLQLVNLGVNESNDLDDRSQTWKDLAWITRLTELPVVAKGIMRASDALSAIRAGVSAIMVSNHGGRQMDSAPATIEVLPDVVDAVNRIKPRRDVYIDGGIRNGWDVYKAIASGAKMAFIGRPAIFGLAKEGENGVRQVVNILRKEFEEAMLLSGASNPSEISGDTLKPDASNCN